jgi:hypothetical protein
VLSDLGQNVHDFEKFTIFSAFVVIIAGSSGSMLLRERSKEALLPFIHTIKPDPIFSRRGNGIASPVSKGTEDLIVKAGGYKRPASPR